MTSSEQKPGPIASIIPGLPLGGCLAIVSRRTCTPDDDERLPTSLNERQVNSSASAGNPSDETIASMTLGPPGWLTHAPMSGISPPYPGGGLARAAYKYFSTTLATAGERMKPKPVDPMFHPIVSCESGYRWLREPSTSGPRAPICSARRAPTATTAAAAA